MAGSEHDNPFLSCQICFEPYDSERHQPKLLPCHHGFCKECIASLIGKHRYFRCPTCRQKTELPKGGVGDLQTNFYVEDISNILESVSSETCRIHNGQALVSFCSSCQVALCYQCTRSEHKESKQHVHQELATASYDLRQKVRNKITVLSDESKETQQGLTHLAKCKEKLLHDKIVAEQEIDLRYREAAKAVLAAMKDRWQAVKKENEETYMSRIIEMTAQIRETEEKLLSLENIKDAFNAAVCDKKHSSILNIASKGGALYTVDTLVAKKTFSKNVPQLKFNEGIWLYAAKQLLSSAGQILNEDQLGTEMQTGKLQISSNPKPGLNCSASFSLSKKADVSINIVDSDGDVIDYSLVEQQSKYFEIQFIPQIPGTHRLEIRHGGLIIPGGDVRINVESNNPVSRIGSKSQEITSFNRPRGVVQDSQSSIYVADMGNGCISKHINSSVLPTIFCSTTSFDIAIDTVSNELMCTVVETDGDQKGWSNTVQIYSLDGVLRDTIKNKHASRALWVAVNSKHHILTSDSNEHVIFVHSRQGKLLKTIGRHGSKAGRFAGPAGLCVGPHDDIIVADRGNKRVQILDSDGHFKTQIGYAGSGKGQFQCPIGVAIDKQNMILVSDWKCNKIQMFQYDGTFLAWIDSSLDTLDGPTGMAVTADGHLLVADCKNHCVKKYRYKDTPEKSLLPDQCCVS